MALIQRDFRKDKHNPLRVRTVSNIKKILTIFLKVIEMKTTRMLTILVLVLGLASEVAKADLTFGESTFEREQLRVLFIGNSLTNQIRSALNSVIQASPYSESTFEYVAPDGWSLQQHTYSENTMSKIRSSDWDFVVLQEYDNRPTLPDRRGQFYDAVAKLSEAIKESGAQVVLYMIWGQRDGDPQNRQINPDYETMQQHLIEAYTEAARQVDAIIAPVGVAWQRVRRNKPDLGLQLYQNDGLHPSYKGAFLTAYVFYATLFDADPTELAFNGGLSAQEAAYLRRKAKEAVIPIVDFNGDGIVDSADMCIMVDHWGEDHSLCDIGPMPWGDGIVDVQDLIVLSEHLFDEVDDPTLVAHWALDDIEGDIASDSANDNDGTVYGDPAWQPQGGIVYGALQLDGIDDYISTPFVLNPTDGKLSVFVWIKGGAPGQAVLSQMGGARWLCTDTSDGNLMTELKGTGRGAAALLSQTVITDGDWHRIGLVWDGSHRTLYVDDVAVAEDTQTNLAASENGLYIGTGTAMELGSFWSGLIDDVRIYNRAVTP